MSEVDLLRLQQDAILLSVNQNQASDQGSGVEKRNELVDAGLHISRAPFSRAPSLIERPETVQYVVYRIEAEIKLPCRSTVAHISKAGLYHRCHYLMLIESTNLLELELHGLLRIEFAAVVLLAG